MASPASAHFADAIAQTLVGLEELGWRRIERRQANQARRQTILNIAVIGAGWAGLAAAIRLRQHGLTPTVFEAAPVAGGRARGVDDAEMGVIDNGQHLLVGAYTATLALIRALHPEQSEADSFTRLALHLESADGRFRMQAPAWPSPLHSLVSLLCARGLSLKERLGALRMMSLFKLSGWRAPAGSTVDQLLQQYRQSDRICRQLWIPLCLATLNTATQEACAQLFLKVLRDTLNAPRTHSDLMIPRTDLTSLWAQQASSLVDTRYRHIVRNVSIKHDRAEVDGEPFDACIIATPPYAVARVLQVDSNQDALTALLDKMNRFSYRAIATLTLQLAKPWSLPQPFLLLEEDHRRGHFGQWVFERTHAPPPTQLAVVISDAKDFLKHDRAQFVKAITDQIREQCERRGDRKSVMPEVLHHRLIVEKRATFAAVPGLIRPPVQTAWTRLFLAGDWTDTGYPAVLEGAVRSGQEAAENLLQRLH